MINIDLLKNNYVGVDIGSGLIKLSFKDKIYEVQTPVKTVKNGVIYDVSQVSMAINELVRSNRLSEKKAVISYNGPGIFTKEIEIPVMQADEIKDYLALEADNILPFPTKEGVIDYIILKKESPMLLLIMALKNDLLIPYIDSVKKGGLIPIGMDIPSLALARALFTNEDGFQLIVDIGKTTSDIHIFKNGIFRFSRIIPIGGDDFDSTLAASMGIDKEQALKDRLSKSYEPMIFKGLLGDLQRELVRSIDYFRYRHGNEDNLEFTKVLIIGGNNSIDGLGQTLEEITLKKPVVKEEPRSFIVKGLGMWRDNQ